MKAVKKLLFVILVGALFFPLCMEGKENDKKDTRREVPCPQCKENVEVPKPLDKKRKSRNRLRKKGLMKCRKCRHTFPIPKPEKKKAVPPKAAPKKS